MKTRQLENIKVTFDDTDHFQFECPDCGAVMKISNLHTQDLGGRIGKTTHIFLVCPVCGGEGNRKTYWNKPTP